MFDFVNLIWSYIEKNEVTKLISLLVIFILFLCLLWEFFSLYSSWRETKKYRKLIKSQDETSFELSPLKPRHDGVQYVRALPQFILNGPRRSKIRYFTTVLTSLGVMGTFMGIMIGLAGIDQKLSGDTSQTFAAVKDLLGGMSTAFITSIVGMVSSLILLVILSLFDKLKHAFHYSLVDTFFKHYCVETLGDYLKNIGGEGQQELLEKQLEVAAKSEQASDALLQMGKSLEKSAENFDADKIGQHISSSLDNIFRTEMVPVFKEISQELSELRAIKQDNGEALLNAIKNEIVTPLTEEIRNTAELVKGSTLAINKLNEDLGDISIKLGESVATIQTFQRETMTELKGFAGDLRDILSGFQTDTKQILEGVADSIRAAVDQSIAGMEDQRDAFKESAQDAAQTFKDIKAELVEALDHQTGLQQSLLNETAKRFDDVIQNSIVAFEKQSDVLRDVGQHASKLMESSRDNLESTLGNIEQSLLNTKQVVEQELGLFRENYQASLTSFFNEQNNLLEQTLGSQRDGLAKVVEDCNIVFVSEYERRKELNSQLETNMGEMQQSVEVVSNLVQSVKMLDAAYVNTIEQAAGAIGRQVAGFEKQQQATQQVLNQFMQQVPEALNSYFDKANDSHVKFFTGMDEAATRIHQRLLQSAEYLVSAQINKQQFEVEEV